ncbi:MAG TPA: MnhB domain-containing protein [Actinomycetota bacterium]|jgi:multicomponent Na+:H+ antiporter subunit A|nr:MnhB domain-containing protein [Actinomycetota bacterium]
MILQTTTRILTPVIVVVAVYLLLRGHDAPGGGFIGGLVAGAAVVLQFLSHGVARMRGLLPMTAGTMLGTGILIACVSGLLPLFFGGEFLEGAVWKAEVPVLGTLKATLSLVFDVGVFLVVVGTVVALVRYLGEEPEAGGEGEA